MWIFALFLSLLDPRKGPPANREDGPFLLTLLLGAMIGVLIASVLLMLWVWRGGHMMLKLDGVDLCRGSYVVRCPWALFHAPGQPSGSSTSRVFVPVNARAIPAAELLKAGRLIARAQAIRSAQLSFKGNCQAVLGGLYAVKIGDVAGLLLHLGHTLGASGLPADLQGRDHPGNASQGGGVLTE